MHNEVLSKRLKLHQLFTIGFGSIVGVGWLMLAGNSGISGRHHRIRLSRLS